jgi:hypothetical protein
MWASAGILVGVPPGLRRGALSLSHLTYDATGTTVTVRFHVWTILLSRVVADYAGRDSRSNGKFGALENRSGLQNAHALLLEVGVNDVNQIVGKVY